MKDDTLITTVKADIFREDLKELGIHPTGYCGFEAYIDFLALEGASSSALVLKDSQSHAEVARVGGKRRLVQRSYGEGVALFFRATGLIRHERLLFMHIPKTAGTTFNTDMRSRLGHRQVVSHIEEMDEKKYNQLAGRFRFVSGHLIFGKFKEHFDLTHDKLYTIIRAPYSHLHSHLRWMVNHYQMGKQNNRDKINPVLFAAAENIAALDFSEPSALADFSRNISGVEARLFDNLQTRHFLDQQVEKVGTAEVSTAISHLPYFASIGLTEEYHLFLHQFNTQQRGQKYQNDRILNRTLTPNLYDFHDPLWQEALFPLVQHDLSVYQEIKRRNHGKSILE